ENCDPKGPLAIEATFDEFNLDVRVHYQGELLELPDRRPTDQEIRESEDGVRRLAGFLVRHNADRARATAARGRVTIHFHFDHWGGQVRKVAGEVSFGVSEPQGSANRSCAVEVDIRAAGGVSVVEPKGRIDSVTAKAFGERVCELIRGGENRVV